jgi:hypothetical protein
VRSISVCFAAVLAAAAAFAQSSPAFHKDVAPILQARCQECHRPGEIGPMPLLTYAQVRPWAKAMKDAVLLGKMPPWPADPNFGKFANDRSLSRAEIDTLAAWADSGAREGDPKDAPPPRKWNDGWNIPTPDQVIELPQGFDVQAKGEIEYQYIVIPTGFTEDKWVEAVEIRPTYRSVVHHAVVFMRDPNSKWLRDAPVGVPYVPKVADARARMVNTGGGDSEILSVYVPGMVPDVWKPGQAKLVKAGTDFVLQMHYTANGKPGKDRTRVGLIFAKNPPTQRVLSLGPSLNRLNIPAGEPNHKAEVTTAPLNAVTVLSLFPHLHLRGKSFQYEVLYPDGRIDTLLKLKSWDLNWQLSYKLAEPLTLPAGSRIRATGWWDNSANNPANPDPKVNVAWGEQSWEEMLVGFVDVAVDAQGDRRSVYQRR